MDPRNGTLYPSVDEALAAGVENPVGLIGRIEDVKRIAAAVRSEWTREQKAARNARNKAAAESRRKNRSR
jgi:hypothetical protein